MDTLTGEYKSLVRNSWRLFYLSHKAWSKAFEDLGLNSTTYPVLEITVQNPGISQRDISDQLSIDKSCTSRACKYLEANGFISKEKSTEHSHGFRCFPTEKAMDAFRKILETEDIHIHSLFQDLDISELIRTNSLLAVLVEKMASQT